METLVVLCLPLLQSLQQVWVAHVFVQCYHCFGNIMVQCMLEVFKVRWRIDISDKCPLVETPRVDSLRAACVMRLLIRAHAVEQGGPYPVPHGVNVSPVVCCDGIAIIVL